MVIFRCSWIFRQLKSMQMGKSEIAKLKAYRLAIQRYQDRAPLSYGPGSGEWPEKFALTLFGAYIR